MKILAIDDNQDNLTTLKAILQDAMRGSVLLTALDGPRGLELARHEDPDVILLDIVMPGMDGFEVCRRLKADPALSSIPVIFLTALRTDRESRIQALAVGAEVFLSKPIDEPELTAQIRAMAKIKAANRFQKMEKAELAAVVAERTQELEQELTQRKLAEAALANSHSLLTAALEATADGILVVDAVGKVTIFNQRFLELWRIPRQLAEAKDDQRLLQFVLDQLQDPAAFLAGVQQLYRTPEADSQDELAFKDGRFFQRHSHPQRIGPVVVGRVWSFRDITLRKQAEAKLTCIAQEWQSTFDATSDAIWVLDNDHRVLRTNKAAAEMFHRPTCGMVGERCWAIAHGTQEPHANCPFVRARQSGHRESMELQDGERWLGVMVDPIRSATGEISGAVHIVSDITERKQVEIIQAFLAQTSSGTPGEPFFNALARFLAENLRMDFVCIDRLEGDGLNARTVAVWHHGKFEDNVTYALKDTPCGDLVGRQVCCFPAHVCQLFPHDQVLQDMGAESYVGATLFDHAGHPIGLIAVIGRTPLTNHSLAETALKMVAVRAAGELERLQAEEDLRRSKERFKRFYEQSPLGYQSMNADGCFLDINPSWERILGYQREEVLGTWFGDYLVPGQKALFHDRFPCFKKLGQVNCVEFEMRHKDGTVRTIAFDGRIEYDGQGAFNRTHCVLSDITERRQLEARLLQSQKMEAIGTLAGGIAHDFNNMLGAIFGFANLLQEDTKDNPAAQESLAEILKAANRAKELVLQILTFSRQREHHRQIIPLDTVVKEALKFVRASAPANIKIQARLDADAPAVLADPTQIYQVTMNLAANALHAMSSRNGELTVTLAPFRPDENQLQTHREFQPILYARLTVADTGHGMDAKTLERIFEPFFTTKEVGQGTGLGLAVVHGIVQAHEGIITVASEVGVGTTFTVYFPGQAVSPMRSETIADQMLEGRGQKVLVVDDEQALTGAFSRLLERLNYRVTISNQPREAVALVRANPERFELVLTDLTMPDMNGMEVARELHAIRPELPVVLMSGFSAGLDPEKMDAAGICELVEKPISQIRLAAALHRALAKLETTTAIIPA